MATTKIREYVRRSYRSSHTRSSPRLTSTLHVMASATPHSPSACKKISRAVARIWAKSSCEEMVPALDPDHLLRFGHRIKNLLQLRSRAILVARAADEQLGLGATGEKFVTVEALVHFHRRPQRDERDYAFIWTRRPQSGS